MVQLSANHIKKQARVTHTTILSSEENGLLVEDCDIAKRYSVWNVCSEDYKHDLENRIHEGNMPVFASMLILQCLAEISISKMPCTFDVAYCVAAIHRTSTSRIT